MLSSTVVAVFIALAYVIGSNGSDNTINSRFDTFSDRTNGLGEQTSQLGGRTNGLGDRTNGLDEQTSQLSDRTNGLGEQTSQLGDRTNGLDEQTSQLSDRTNGLGEQTSRLGGRTNGLGEQTSQLSDRTNGLSGRTNGLSGRTNGLSDRTNGLDEQTSRLSGRTNGLSDRTNGLGEQTIQISDRTNGLGEQASQLSDLTDKHVLFQVTNQPDTEPAAKASMPNMGSANEYGVKERCERYTMKNQGLEREYYLYRPEGLKAGAPLVIVLHGYGGSALKGKKAMMDVADRNGFAVCYPQGIKDPKGKPGWNVRYPSQKGMKTDDVKFLIALSKELQKKFDLSPKNTFLTGMSNGGDIIYLIAMRAPKAFKAMASIAGLQFNWMETEYSYKHPLPFMEVHGTQDHTSEWLGDPENKGGWGAYIPVPAAVSRIIAVNGCTEEYVTELPRRDGRYQVTLYQFTGGKPAVKGGRPTEVWLYKVEGGDHSWSDKDMDTCSEIWRFFSQWID